jgi:hypothetical protein
METNVRNACVAAGLLALSDATLATNQSRQRQEGSNANQATKHETRTAKVDSAPQT